MPYFSKTTTTYLPVAVQPVRPPRHVPHALPERPVLRLDRRQQRLQMRQRRRRLPPLLVLPPLLPNTVQVQEDQVPAPHGDRDLHQPEVAGAEVLDAFNPRGLGQPPVEPVSD